MDMMEQIAKIGLTYTEERVCKELRESEDALRERFGASYDFFKNIRVQLMSVQSKLYGRSYKMCCMDHLGVIDARRGDETKKLEDRLFMLILILEHELYEGAYA